MFVEVIVWLLLASNTYLNSLIISTCNFKHFFSLIFFKNDLKWFAFVGQIYLEIYIRIWRDSLSYTTVINTETTLQIVSLVISTCNRILPLPKISLIIIPSIKKKAMTCHIISYVHMMWYDIRHFTPPKKKWCKKCQWKYHINKTKILF